MSKKQVMSVDTMDRAWDHYYSFFGNPKNSASNSFWDFVGITSGSHIGITRDNTEGDEIGWPATPEQARRIEILAGPHWYAALKALKCKAVIDG